jgi:hypothetical protein
MERGWDPEVKKYFKKVINSLCIGLLWMMAMVTLGLYFGWASGEKSTIYVILFYVILGVTLGLLLRYYYKTWK